MLNQAYIFNVLVPKTWLQRVDKCSYISGTNSSIGYVTLVAITGTTILVPQIEVKLLQLI